MEDLQEVDPTIVKLATTIQTNRDPRLVIKLQAMLHSGAHQLVSVVATGIFWTMKCTEKSLWVEEGVKICYQMLEANMVRIKMID